MNYEQLTEITVKTQEELDMIPKDFKGRIYIEFGSEIFPAVIKNRYYRSVEARGNSSVVARENSSVEAWENSSVVAWENSSVEAWGNSQIVDCLRGGKIKISGNARIVYNPKNIHDFMDFYDIKHDKKNAIFYKAVRKSDDGTYYSDYNSEFTYVIGEEKVEMDIDKDVNEECGTGINIAHLNWALNFGEDWHNLAILEVETKIANIICPLNTTGKVRTSAVKVLREVPLEECGVFGKILAKRIKKN